MTPRPSTFYDRSGDRWYRDPSNPSKTYAGVTSILNTLNKPGLNKAKVNGVAKYAAKNRKMLAEQNQATVESILKNTDAVLPDWVVGREFGTAAHQVVENMIKGNAPNYKLGHVEGTPTYPVSNTFVDWVTRCWQEFVVRFEFEPTETEQTVLSDAHGYGGSLDMMGYITTPDKGRHLAIVDLKTNKKGPMAGSVALQNVAYARADEFVNIGTGERRPIPRIEGSYVLWMHEHTQADKPDWDLFPLAFGQEQWRTFYGLLLAFAHSKKEHTLMGDSMTGKDLFKRWTP